MVNFRQTPIRLDSTSCLTRMFYIFVLYEIIIFITYTCFVTIPISNITKGTQTNSNVRIASVNKPTKRVVLSTASSEEESISSLELSETLVCSSASRIPTHLYLHLENHSKFSWVPIVVEEKLSEGDIAVDLSSVIDSSCAYTLSEFHLNLVNLAVYRESGNQPFFGQLLVAEDIIARIRSGIYGPDISAILVNGYEAKVDKNGNLHFYNGSTEILEASSSVKEAVKLALSGSRASYLLLQAVTELRNEQYHLQLDDRYYKWGAMYHFSIKNPKISPTGSRSLNRVPVSFQFGDHIFYGYWLPKSAKLHL